MLHKAWNSKGEMHYCFPRSSIKFQGHSGQNITDFDPNWAFPDYRPVAAFKSFRFALFSIVVVMHQHCLLLNNTVCLTHLPMDKMAAAFADDIFKCIFMDEKFCISIWISLKYVPKCPIDNEATLVQIMAWCGTGDKQLPEPMLTQFTDAYMWH